MVTHMIELARLRAADLRRPDVQFTDGEFSYVSSGKELGHGGMGQAYLVTRWRNGGPQQVVVAKTFRDEYMVMVHEDLVSHRQFEHFERLTEEVNAVQHPNVLPVLGLQPISDNYVLFTPLGGASLLNLVAINKISPKERIDLLLQSLDGLAALHKRGIVHRDFTLHNVLTLGDRAAVFDFDISVVPHMLDSELRTYTAWYEGRLLGSPEFSIAPELLDDVLGQQPISPRVDVYAVGTAIFGLFCDDSVYGPVPDLASLLQRIAEGVVHKRESRIRYPESVPTALRPIIERCLEREPNDRYADASEVMQDLSFSVTRLTDTFLSRRPLRKTVRYDVTTVSWRIEDVFHQRLDRSITMDEIRAMQATLQRYGYLVEQSLGRVKGHAIYLAMPDPGLVAAGRFPEENTYRKIVTAIDLGGRANSAGFVHAWLTRIFPTLQRVRQGYLTPLYKVAFDRQSKQLLLFSEYISDPRFGTDLAEHELELSEAFGLGLIAALSIKRLHDHGLAHDNVHSRSLVFKGFREHGRVQPMLLGLVEPSFDPDARQGDARNVSALIVQLVRDKRIHALEPNLRPVVKRARTELERVARGDDEPQATIENVIELCSRALGAIEPNFQLVRTHGGDVAAFADMLVRHSLYNKLYMLDVRD